jgi:uncharacterized protein YciI
MRCCKDPDLSNPFAEQGAVMGKRHFMYVLNPLAFDTIEEMTETHQRIARTHFEYLKRLNADETIVMAGRTEHGELGVVVIEVESEDAAREIMENDPSIKHGLMSATLYPYRLALLRGQGDDAQ